jgi:hypothetical protein
MAVLVYSVLRLALLAVVWLVIELVTPVHGVWAVVVALLISGAISVVVLDRQRGAVGQVAAGFFGRINDRIEAATRAEDGEEAPASAPAADLPPADGPAADVADAVSGQGEAQAQGQAVDQQ